MPENISPEERLLNVITEQEKKSTEHQKLDQDKKTSNGKLVWVFGLSKVFSKDSSSESRIVKAGRSLFRIAWINRSLMAINILLFLVIVSTLVSSQYNVSALVYQITTDSDIMIRHRLIEKLQPLEYYQELVRKRDIFSPPFVPEKYKPPVVNKAPQVSTLEQLLKDYRLVGISWGGNPEALIKDVTVGQLHFVRMGQLIGRSQIKVKEIQKGRVIVVYKNEERELQ